MKSMAAIHLEYGDKVKVEELDIPDPMDTQVIVKLKSSDSTICFISSILGLAPRITTDFKLFIPNSYIIK